jgi:hypothetical protein
MVGRFYPVILVAILENEVRCKIIRGGVEYGVFITRFKIKAVGFIEIKTLEALYMEKMSPFNPGISRSF